MSADTISTKRRFRRLWGARHGSALLIVLALLVLCSVVTLAFLSRSMLVRMTAGSSEGSLHGDLVARAATEEIIESLREEILAGSTNRTVAGVSIHHPATPTSAFPSRSVAASVASNTNFANLIKQSFTNVPTYTSTNVTEDFPTRAEFPAKTAGSALSTRTPGKDGRYLSARRWNSPRLLFGDGLGDDQLPHWVYLTRSGPLNSAANSDVSRMADRAATNSAFAIGRYAYQVYDISGLLDINLAGHPTLSPKDISELKGTLSGAVLESILGLTSSTNFMKWRTMDMPSGQFFDNQISNTNGFLKAGPNERRFFNRQDLLRYATSVNSISTNALPYLTVFNCKKNAPVFEYPTQGDVVANSTNASPLQTRMNAAGSSPLDGFSWRTGDPVVPRKFPLSRLNWLQPDGPKLGITPARIKAAFGLIWDARPQNDTNPANLTGDRWVYVGSDGSDDPDQPATKIQTLQEVAAEGREPNFFELLKAAIHRGSLAHAVMDSFAPESDILYGEHDIHILRLGACIIDQYDADSYPTLINFKINADAYTPRVEIYGVEDLPYISRIAPFYINPDWPNDPGPTNRRMEGFIVPEIWNPHQKSSVASAQPEELRVVFTGAHRLRTGTGNIHIKDNIFNLSSGTARFAKSAYDAFREPRPLTQSITSGTGYFARGIPFKDFPPSSSDLIVGAELLKVGNMIPTSGGADWDGYYDTGNQHRSRWTRDHLGDLGLGGRFDAILQYKNAQGRFQNYNVMAAGFMTDVPALNTRFGLEPRGAANAFLKTQFPIPDLNAWERTADPLSAPDFDLLKSIYKQGGHSAFKSDPRTARLGVTRHDFNVRKESEWASSKSFAAGLRPMNSGEMASGPATSFPEHNAGTYTSTINFPTQTRRQAMYERNVTADGAESYYTDNDGIARPGDNRFQDWADSVYNNSSSRPLILNRPFRSVAELGYVYRDLPFRSIDLNSESSVDTALLDYFCLNESQGVVGGVVNLNAAPASIIESLIRGAGRTPDTDSTPANPTISDTEAQSLASSLIQQRAKTPLTTTASLVNATATNSVTSATSGLYPGVKARREALIRSLASVHNERTWNLFIDVIAQTGQFPPQAAQLSDFTVEGERRYWIHLAIDRYTGEVVEELRELVLE